MKESISEHRQSAEVKSGDANVVGAHDADFSLASNGETYLQRADEAQRIFERIERSSSSVTGIAGVRGAGKSSLAKKVLSAASQKGYFWILVPSPISYEPREFLLAVFQRIVEYVSERTRLRLIEGSENLADLGEQRAKEIKWQYNILMTGIVLCIITIVAVLGYNVNEFAEASRASEVQVISKTIKADLNLLEQQIRNIKPSDVEFEKLSDRRRDLTRQLERLEEAIASKPWRDAILMLPVVIIVSIVYGIVVFLHRVAQRLLAKYRILSKFPKEAGLEASCETMLQLLTFQTTLSSARDVGFSLKGITGKLTKGTQLTERPLSLPGLTATFAKFLTEVADVFNGKVVICIDELDKISDPDQLIDLLKGIKGVLGQEHTHFLLTVSEDAMALFTERLSADRNLIESSFEQIVYLDRLTRVISRQVVEQTMQFSGNERGGDFDRNCLLLWIFAGGVPREIKRNIFTAVSNGLHLTQSSSTDVWKRLFFDVVSSMQTNPPRNAAAESQFFFLRGLEELKSLTNSIDRTDDFQASVQKFSRIVTKWFKPLLRSMPEWTSEPDKSPSKISPDKSPSKISPYPALVAQIVLGFLALGAVSATPEKDRPDHLDSLIYVSKYVLINPRYALFGLKSFLGGRLKYLYEDTDQTAEMEKALTV